MSKKSFFSDVVVSDSSILMNGEVSYKDVVECDVDDVKKVLIPSISISSLKRGEYSMQTMNLSYGKTNESKFVGYFRKYWYFLELRSINKLAEKVADEKAVTPNDRKAKKCLSERITYAKAVLESNSNVKDVPHTVMMLALAERGLKDKRKDGDEDFPSAILKSFKDLKFKQMFKDIEAKDNEYLFGVVDICNSTSSDVCADIKSALKAFAKELWVATDDGCIEKFTLNVNSTMAHLIIKYHFKGTFRNADGDHELKYNDNNGIMCEIVKMLFMLIQNKTVKKEESKEDSKEESNK